jgi:two-component system, chemotaxis family, response regulator WspR
VILQDLVMSTVDGLALVRAYRAEPSTRDIPVIVLSSAEEANTKADAFNSGANDYLVKLPSTIELVARIRYHTRAYLNQIQRDEAYGALRESQQKLLEMNLELQRLNNTDALTELKSRRYFDEYLQNEWLRAVRERTSLCALLIDVDDFKLYNDTYGHLKGDEVLRQVASAIKTACARSSDLTARFGGEEFAAVLPNTTLEGAQKIAEDMRHAVQALQIPRDAATTGNYLTATIGVASVVPVRESSPDIVLAAADKALYEAKSAGKNRVVVA